MHHALGPGFEEVVYQRALAGELPAHGLEYDREVWIGILFKGEKVGRKGVGFVIGDETGDVMEEIKAKAALEDVDAGQALSGKRINPGHKKALASHNGYSPELVFGGSTETRRG